MTSTGLRSTSRRRLPQQRGRRRHRRRGRRWREHRASVEHYVFDGRKRSPYVESDPTGPLSAYGRSRLAGETSVAVANPNHFIVRSSWLFGVAGRNFVETMLHLAEQQPEVRVVSDQVGCPTCTGHLATRSLAHGIWAYPDSTTSQRAARARGSSSREENLRPDRRRVPRDGGDDRHARSPPRDPRNALEGERPDAIELPEWRRGLADYLRERRTARSEAAA